MKWIGQHIVDFIARFRSDVYMEDISDGIVTGDKFLGLNQYGKIVKKDIKVVSGVGDITGVDITAGTGIDVSQSGATTGNYTATIGVDVSDFMTNGADNRVITATGTDTMNAENGLTFNSGLLSLSSTAVAKPNMLLSNSNEDANCPQVTFQKTATGDDGDDLGMFTFKGDNDADEVYTFGKLLCEIADATDGEEAGRLAFQVAEYDGTLTTGLFLDGDTDANGEVDVTIGAGAGSTTTVAGTLTMGSTAFANNSGAIQVATQGTIDHDSLANFVPAEHVDWAGASAGTIHASNYTDTTTNTQNTTVLSFVDSSNDILLRNTTGGAGSGTDDIKFVAGGNITLTHTDADNITIAATDGSTDVTLNANVTDVLTLSTQAISATDPGDADILAGWDHSANKFTYLSAADSITALGLGTSAVLDTAAIANGGAGVATADQIHTFVTMQTDAMDADTAGNAATATLAADATTLATPRAINGVDFDGSAAITVTAAGSTLSDTVTVAKGGTGLTTVAANTMLTGNGTSALTAEANLTYDGTNLQLASDAVSAPDLTLLSTSNHVTGSNFVFKKLRADDTPADGDVIGSVIFLGEDDGGALATYASMVGVAKETGSGEEGGKLSFNVASHDGTLQPGLVIEDGSTGAEVDATIGAGAASVTTVAGTLTMGGTAALTNAGLVAVANQSNITGVGALASGTIATGFGNIDTGSSTIDTTGAVSTGTLSADQIKHEVSGASAGDIGHGAEVVYFGSGTVVAGLIYYYKSDGSWVSVRANDVTTSSGLLGVALDGGTASSVGMCIRGMVCLLYDSTGGVGDVLWLEDATNGRADNVAPVGNGDIARVIGYCLNADGKRIFFNPDNTFVEVSA